MHRWPRGWRRCAEVEREFHDQFIDKNAKTFKDLGLVPGDIANFTYAYLVSIRLVGSNLMTWIQANKPFLASLPQRLILRPPSHVREGEARGEEVPARPGRPIESEKKRQYETSPQSMVEM